MTTKPKFLGPMRLGFCGWINSLDSGPPTCQAIYTLLSDTLCSKGGRTARFVTPVVPWELRRRADRVLGG